MPPDRREPRTAPGLGPIRRGAVHRDTQARDVPDKPCAILLVSALISYWLTKRRQNEFWQDSPTRLFHDLCRGHQLELATRRLLKKLALARGLESAAELFIEPNYFNPAGLPPAFEPSAHELQRLRRTLFG